MTHKKSVEISSIHEERDSENFSGDTENKRSRVKQRIKFVTSLYEWLTEQGLGRMLKEQT